ncbi:OmcA/MtrC family decaheme c-type cytochrome [Shewanella xiamenensis]|uniref:OmcA/MtrC family decaheme c-type cytochrome n=1 Tax=Shewanella xiamenensis TaxID=332186 RepID=UPI0024A63FD7|nr:OmcA/MtrC family decaheme c-type cytochrome [Shewanella xiamenensis]MDI5836818.1 OmcA/MtrC family decaheme c-type cytochrome [Shewanella xiamenensis]MDI5841067.1 OmcA/MtrC family decaheme c-type cytochrome [Shewanella xiamenensis]MDI5843677.1 OmcA/MtrC family decaheme c-type cytochrome [Shewanella xiamenensis]MDI5848632.1 OmcA/MtrC family decaheme c-type cytochrome [Shewanella xiamenensis]MDI5851760.1 OmcA/MtrC family decaheme c-type cytochrome [Shewanella xiamenensis]
MMNTKKSKIALLLAASAFSMALTGCGSDGKDGPDGNPGNPGGEPAGTITKLNLDITKVSYENGAPIVTVFATNEADMPVVGLANLEIKNAVQLVEGEATGPGNSANWQGLGSSKTYVDNKNGSYTFKFDAFDSNKVFNTQLTQRFNVVSAAGTLPDGTTVPVAEMVEDFDGQGNAPLYTKNIVSHEVCAACHVEGEKIYHIATEVETCITCHTQEFADKRGKPQVVFAHLIHNVHNSNKAWGKNLDKDAKTAHAIVKDNCQACHVESDMLSEANNWSRVPTMEVCTSCHVGIDFAAGKGHSTQLDNSNCIACHKSEWTAEIHTGKTAATKNLINQYGIETTSTINAETQAATISIQVVDASGAVVDLKTILPKVQRLEIITNVGPNNATLGYGGKDSIFAVKNGVLDPKATINDAGKLVYTTTKDLKLGQNGADSDTAFSFVGWSMCSAAGQFVDCTDPAFDGVDKTKYTGMKADLVFATLSGNAPSTRHVDSVNMTTCANCHTAEFEIHKGKQHAGFVMTEQLSHTQDANGKAIIGLDACVTCHTPDGTYSFANRGALELKLHKTHVEKAYGLIGGNCVSCHTDFNLESFKHKGALNTAAAEDKTGLYSTPIAATCTTCHTVGSQYMVHTKEQLESFGAVIDGTKDVATNAAQSETCFYCHKPTPTDHTQVKM